MKQNCIERIRENLSWTPTELPPGNDIPIGDMPGDKVLIDSDHIVKATTIFPELLKLLLPVLEDSACKRAVVSVCGGSGVGKSETASLLTYYLNQIGVGAYTLSGDNYPHRIPKHNDAERLRIFRQSGIRGLLAFGQYTVELGETLCKWQRENIDTDTAKAKEVPWLSLYQRQGDFGLKNFLGTQNEIDFQEASGILSRFKNGENTIFLKRMGREEGSVSYQPVDFSKTNTLVLEWTHGNNDNLIGVDIPVFLYSTPGETLAHRQARARDKGVDSPFTGRVLNLEAELLATQVQKAKLIISKDNRLMTHSELGNP